MSSFKALTAALSVWFLSACGFQPLYGQGEGTIQAVNFSDIQIVPIKDQIGQQLRNELVRLLHARGQTRVPRYRLRVELQESASSLAVRKSALATRANLTVIGNFQLLVIGTGRDAFAGTSKSTVSYNIFDSEFSTLMAEKDARQRALRSMSEDIRVRLGVFLRRGE